jgi:hypothetical protein
VAAGQIQEDWDEPENAMLATNLVGRKVMESRDAVRHLACNIKY